MTDKSTKNRITKNTLDKIQQDLKALALAPPDDFSAKETVRHLLPTIDEALSNGRTMAQIHEALTKRAFQIKPSTLAKYLRDARLEADAIAPELAADSGNTPSATDQDAEGPKPSIKLMSFDEAEGILPDTDDATEVARSPDDEVLDARPSDRATTSAPARIHPA